MLGSKSLCRSVHMCKLYLWRVQKGQEGWTCLTLVTLTSTRSRKHCGKLHPKRASLVTLCLLTLKPSVLVTFVRVTGQVIITLFEESCSWVMDFITWGLAGGFKLLCSNSWVGPTAKSWERKQKTVFSSLCLGTCISQNIGEMNIKWRMEHNCSMHVHRDWGWTRLHHT